MMEEGGKWGERETQNSLSVTTETDLMGMREEGKGGGQEEWGEEVGGRRNGKEIRDGKG